MNAVLLTSIFLAVIVILGILSKGNLRLKGKLSVFPPTVEIELENKKEKEKPEKAKKKK